MLSSGFQGSLLFLFAPLFFHCRFEQATAATLSGQSWSPRNGLARHSQGCMQRIQSRDFLPGSGLPPAAKLKRRAGQEQTLSHLGEDPEHHGSPKGPCGLAGGGSRSTGGCLMWFGRARVPLERKEGVMWDILFRAVSCRMEMRWKTHRNKKAHPRLGADTALAVDPDVLGDDGALLVQPEVLLELNLTEWKTVSNGFFCRSRQGGWR